MSSALPTNARTLGIPPGDPKRRTTAAATNVGIVAAPRAFVVSPPSRRRVVASAAAPSRRRSAARSISRTKTASPRMPVYRSTKQAQLVEKSLPNVRLGGYHDPDDDFGGPVDDHAARRRG